MLLTQFELDGHVGLDESNAFNHFGRESNAGPQKFASRSCQGNGVGWGGVGYMFESFVVFLKYCFFLFEDHFSPTDFHCSREDFDQTGIDCVLVRAFAHF